MYAQQAVDTVVRCLSLTRIVTLLRRDNASYETATRTLRKTTAPEAHRFHRRGLEGALLAAPSGRAAIPRT